MKRNWLRLAVGFATVILTAAPAMAQSDDCTSAIPITDSGTLGVATLYPFSTVGFVVAGPIASCNGQANATDGWYLYTAAVTGNATFATCPCSTLSPGGSSPGIDMTIAVWDSAACPPTSQLGCNDDTALCFVGGPSEVTIPVVALGQYFVQIGDWANAVAGFAGTLSVTVNSPPAPPAAPPAPPAYQGLRQTLPKNFENASTGFITATPFGASYSCSAAPVLGQRMQYTFDTSMFEFQGPQRINSIRFRQHATVVQLGGTAINVEVGMTSSPLDMLAQSNTMANNLGPDFQICNPGATINFPAGNPNAFGYTFGYEVNVPFTTPFLFNPKLGKDLLIQVRTLDLAQLSMSSLEVSFGVARTHGSTTSATATTTNTGLVTAPLIFLDYTPLPYFKLTNSGPGVGDLQMSLTDIPAGMVQGWTCFTSDATKPFNTGPIYGIYPTQLTFDIFVDFPVPAIGNPLAFVVGAPFGLYPTSTFFAVPGSLLGLSGLTWDAVTLGTTAFNSFVAKSNVQRISF